MSGPLLLKTTHWPLARPTMLPLHWTGSPVWALLSEMAPQQGYLRHHMSSSFLLAQGSWIQGTKWVGTTVCLFYLGSYILTPYFWVCSSSPTLQFSFFHWYLHSSSHADRISFINLVEVYFSKSALFLKFDSVELRWTNLEPVIQSKVRKRKANSVY